MKPSSVSTPAQDATALADERVITEMQRVRRLFERSSSDKEDLISYAKEVVALRTTSQTPAQDATALAEKLVQRHASAYVARGAAISDSIIAECKASREALLAALRATSQTPDGYVLVPTLQTVLRKLFTYDRETGIFRRSIKTSPQSAVGEVAGYKRPDGYVTLHVEGRKYGAHRLAWVYTYGDIPDGMQIDHVNQNHSDNRLSNLRLATQSENKINTARPISNGYRGVYSYRGSHAAKIKKDGKRVWIGTFDDPEKAARAYDQKARELHGEFAVLNFPDEGSQP